MFLGTSSRCSIVAVVVVAGVVVAVAVAVVAVAVAVVAQTPFGVVVAAVVECPWYCCLALLVVHVSVVAVVAAVGVAGGYGSKHHLEELFAVAVVVAFVAAVVVVPCLEECLRKRLHSDDLVATVVVVELVELVAIVLVELELAVGVPHCYWQMRKDVERLRIV